MNLKGVIKKSRALIVRIILVFIFVKITTFGGVFSKEYKLYDLNEAQIYSQMNMKRIVEYLANDIGKRDFVYTQQLEQTYQFIVREFMSLGYKVIPQEYTAGQQTFKNIMIEHPNNQQGREFVIIGAHYDSCDNPGADDNASGIAGLLELAQLLKDETLSINLKFIAFVNEEPPFFKTEKMGSRVYARQAKEEGEKIKVAIVFDMIGFYSDESFSQRYFPVMGAFFPNRANFITFVGNFKTRKIVNELKENFKQNSDFPVESIVGPDNFPGISFSDHWSFWKEGYPALMITDTAYMRNPYYHKSSDTPETLDYKRMAIMIYGLKEAIMKTVDID